MIQHYQQQVYAQQQEQQQQQFDNSSSKPLRPQERDIFIIHSPLNLHPLLIPRQARRLSYLLAIPKWKRTPYPLIKLVPNRAPSPSRSHVEFPPITVKGQPVLPKEPKNDTSHKKNNYNGVVWSYPPPYHPFTDPHPFPLSLNNHSHRGNPHPFPPPRSKNNPAPSIPKACPATNLAETSPPTLPSPATPYVVTKK